VKVVIAIVVALTVWSARAHAQQAPSFNEPRQKITIDPIVVARPAREAPDQRPYFLVGGAMILAAVFIWNRAREKKLEAEHGPTPRRNRRWRVKPDADGDPDADALADAASADEDQKGKS
jgi:hypothetical protein